MTRAREKLFLLSSGIPSRYIYEINEEYLEIIDDVLTNNNDMDNDIPF
jgi:hypothetical protein